MLCYYVCRTKRPPLVLCRLWFPPKEYKECVQLRMIRRLENTTVHKMKSQQYFADACSILKELVENALDACASHIRITMDTRSITVEDDGDGISDLASVGDVRCTSKLEETYRALGYRDDCAGEDSFSYGFRGQALYALKDMADVTILTKKRETSQVPRSGPDSVQHAHLPAPQKGAQDHCALHKNLSTGAITRSVRECGTTVTISNIFKSLPVRRNLLNMKRELPRIIHLLESYTLVHSAKVSLRFEGRLLLSRAGCRDTLLALRRRYPLETFYEKKTDLFALVIGDSPGKEGFIFYRKRPVRNSVLAKAVQDAYSLFRKGRPLFVLDVKSRCDFSLSPDKMDILIGAKDNIVYGVRCAVEELFSTSCVVRSGSSNRSASDTLSNSSSSLCTEEGTACRHADGEAGDAPDGRVAAEACPPSGPQHSVLADTSGQEGSGEPRSAGERNANVLSAGMAFARAEPLCEKNKNTTGFFYAKRTKTASKSSVAAMCARSDAPATQANETCFDSRRHLAQGSTSVPCPGAFSFIAADAPAEIHKKIEKGDFSRMEVVGQFNSGFILCTLSGEDETTLLIIDQHASDEIQNFERLERSVQLKRQLLINNVPLRLSPVDAFLVESNTETFQRNGFLLQGNELAAVPVYGDTIFGVDDFYSLVENIKCGKLCFDRLRDIIASKACRASIMIGEALDHRRMCSVVRNLSTLKSPWCCPHGRPVFKILDIWRHR